MTNTKGLTLIELLAVIVIMAVLALITTPIIIGVINSAKEQANRRSVDGLVRAGTYYLSESLLDQEKAEKIKNQENLINEISYEGKGPEVGQLYVNEKSEVALAVKYGDKCYKKEYTGYIETLEYNNINCKLNINIKKPEVTIGFDNVFNEHGWANSNFNVAINATDYSGLGVSIKWCGTSNQSCDPTTIVPQNKLVLPISQETSGSKICAISVDGFGNESGITCSEYYKLDKTAPTFDGLTDIVMNQDDVLDLESGVTLTDALSGVESILTYSPTDVDRTKAGEYTITYTGKDNAGNTGTGSRKVTVHTSAPSISFTPEPNKINSNGWSKENLYITITTVDYSSYGIGKLVWCGTTGNTCEPTTEVNNASQSVLLQTENNNHHICAYAIDKFGQQSETICSGAYKLDKTSPSFTGIEDITINVGGSINLENGVSAIDSLSGINGTYSYNPTTIDTSKTGSYPVTYRVEDLAGNIKEITRNVIVTSGNPTINFTAASGAINANGWAKSNFYVTVNSTDYSGHGIEKLVWCGTTGNTCIPSTEVSVPSQNILISQESNNNRICAYAIDKGGHTGSTTCSDAYKLDKTAPTFGGLGTLNVAKGASVNLTSGVTTNDTLSGISGNYNYNPTSVDTSTTKSVTITYTVTDLAGNSTTQNRIVNVTANKPTVSFTPTSGAINANGWAKANFYVTVNSTDYSGHGIDRIVWCGTTGGSCTPTTQVNATSASVLISTESSTNKICSYAVDKYGQIGETSCSSVYKLDKTAPTAGILNINGSLGSNNWYTSNVTLSVNNGSDTLSGHASTTTSHTSITSNTAGTTVTVTTSDLAGNTATRTYTIKVDKNTPTLVAKAPSYTITQGDNLAVANYFNTPIYSISGGNLSCNPTDTGGLAIGTQAVSCTATGGNGLIGTASVSIIVKGAPLSLDLTITPTYYYLSYQKNGIGTIAEFSKGNTSWYTTSIYNVNGGSNLDLITTDTYYYLTYEQGGNGYVAKFTINGNKGSASNIYTISGGSNLKLVTTDTYYYLMYEQGGNGYVATFTVNGNKGSASNIYTISGGSNLKLVTTDTYYYLTYEQGGNGYVATFTINGNKGSASNIYTISGGSNLKLVTTDTYYYLTYEQGGNGYVATFTISGNKGSAKTFFSI